MSASFGYNDHLQLLSLAYSKGGTPLLSLTYAYGTNNNGQIQAITDNAVSSRSTTYTYDELSRLSQAQTNDLTSANTWRLAWTYDRYGNRLSQTLTGGTLSATQPSLAVSASTNRITTGGYTYDASGNMTSDSINSYVYDAANRIVSVSANNVTHTYVYDAHNWRVKKDSTVYIYSGSQVIAEYASGGAAASPQTEYVYSDGGLLQTISSGTITYHHPDQLSNRAETNASGASVRSFGHLPFGDAWYETGTDKWKFTSYERDSESSLDYALNRFDSSRLGRFMSPDPYSGNMDVANPQSMNRYAYVGNDPEDFTDPFGLYLCNICGRPPAPEPAGGGTGGGFGGGVDPGPPPLIFRPGAGGGGGGGASSICSDIPSNGRTVPVALGSGPMSGTLSLQFNGQGNLIGIGVSLTTMNPSLSSNLSIPANTSAGFTLTSPGTVQFGFSNPVRVGSGLTQAYVQTATFSGGKFTAVTGAFAPIGIPLGSKNGNSSILLAALNNNLPVSTSSISSTAQQFGNALTTVATTLSQNVSCQSIFGGG